MPVPANMVLQSRTRIAFPTELSNVSLATSFTISKVYLALKIFANAHTELGQMKSLVSNMVLSTALNVTTSRFTPTVINQGLVMKIFVGAITVCLKKAASVQEMRIMKATCSTI